MGNLLRDADVDAVEFVGVDGGGVDDGELVAVGDGAGVAGEGGPVGGDQVSGKLDRVRWGVGAQEHGAVGQVVLGRRIGWAGDGQ